jgi:elongation factor P--(R)-beta-lysine ligase
MFYSSSPSILLDRAEMLSSVRNFFRERNVLEVDCPSLVRFPAIDTNIEVMDVSVSDSERGYLHTSPEYAMKRLLTAGLKDIYQIAHVFRKGEIGARHSPEFTMIEWYRLGMTYDALIEETCAIICLFIGRFQARRLSYRDAFIQHVGIDPFTISRKELLARVDNSEIDHALKLENEDNDTLLQLLLTHYIEPKLGMDELTVLYEFPASQAALAKTYMKNGHAVAERYEIYFQSIELCNGYHELSNSQELRSRFQAENDRRSGIGKEPYPLDEPFLEALDRLPDCCGVSVGFDRLMMLRHKKRSIQEILPFAWLNLH